jgi:HAD superfamily hydrolase (TIGR01549 family)
MIQSFIFDIGNVIIPFDFSIALRALQAQCKRPILELMERLEPIKAAYENGRMKRAEFIAQTTAIIEFTGTEADFTKAWQEIFVENEAMNALVEQLQPQYPLYLLSNTSDLHADYFEAQYPVFQRFTGAVYSHIVCCSKPDRVIYEIAAKQFGVNPNETVFIDDLPANIAAAREVGYHAIQYDFRNHEALLEELKTLGVSLP